MSNKILVQEILERITRGLDSVHCNQEQQRQSYGARKSILVILTGSSVELEAVLRGLKKLKNYGSDLTVVMSQGAEKVIGSEKIKSWFSMENLYREENWDQCLEMIQRMDALLVPTLTQNTAAKLWYGIQDTVSTLCIWQGLWLGKPVFASTRAMFQCGGNRSKNPALEKIIEENLQGIEKMGVQLFDHRDYWLLIDSLEKKREMESPIPLEQMDGECTKKVKKNILTQKDVLQRIENQNQLHIRKGSLFTPLAKDWIKERQIQVIEE